MTDYLVQVPYFPMMLVALSLAIIICWSTADFVLAKTWFLVLLIIWYIMVMSFFLGYCEFTAATDAALSEWHYCQKPFFKDEFGGSGLFALIVLLAILQHRETKIKALSEKIDELNTQLKEKTHHETPDKATRTRQQQRR